VKKHRRGNYGGRGLDLCRNSQGGIIKKMGDRRRLCLKKGGKPKQGMVNTKHKKKEFYFGKRGAELALKEVERNEFKCRGVSRGTTLESCLAIWSSIKKYTLKNGSLSTSERRGCDGQ